MAFVLFGTKGVTVTQDFGEFYCPQCRADRPYVKKEMQRKGHLYFVPVVKLGSLGEYVECGVCQGQFDPQVLTLPTTAEFERKLELAVRSAVAAMVRADDAVREREWVAGTKVVSGLLGRSYSIADLRSDLEEVNEGHVTFFLDSISEMLTPEGKAQILQSCVLIALSDGEIHEDEVGQLERIADALEIPPHAVPGIIETTLREMERRSR